MKKIILYALVLLLPSCATISQDECQVADWQAIGFQHGAQGEKSTVFEQYRKDCAKYQIKADFESFQQGYQYGLNDYCTFENGLSTGKDGDNYNNQCPRSRYPDFEEGYQAGLKRYCTYDRGYTLGENGVSTDTNCDETEFPNFKTGQIAGYAKFEIFQDIEILEEELLKVKHKTKTNIDHISRLEAIIISDTSTPATRSRALEKIKYYEKEQHRLDFHYLKEKKRLAHLEYRLNNM